MKYNKILCSLIFCVTINVFSQSKEIKKEIKIESKNHIQKLLDGKIRKYINDYDKGYIHIDGGRNKDGSIDFNFEKKRIKKIHKKRKKQAREGKNIDVTKNKEKIKILNYNEVIEEYKSIDNYGFVLKENDYFVIYALKNESFGSALLVGVYRKIKGKWKIVAGDF